MIVIHFYIYLKTLCENIDFYFVYLTLYYMRTPFYSGEIFREVTEDRVINNCIKYCLIIVYK